MATFQTEEAEILSNYLPSGKVWQAKTIEGSNLNGLINGLGYEFKNIQEKVDYLKKELSILTTEDMIAEWEKAYGIPNEWFQVDGLTLEERRLQLLVQELMVLIIGLIGYILLIYLDIQSQSVQELRFREFLLKSLRRCIINRDNASR